MQNSLNILGKKTVLLAASAIFLASCHDVFQPSPAQVCVLSKDVVLNIVEKKSDKEIGTMQFLPLRENTISIHFEIKQNSQENFCFRYSADLFEILYNEKDPEEQNTNESMFFGKYLYAETKESLNKKLSKVTFGEETTIVSKEVSNSEMLEIAIHGTGDLVFEYNTSFDASKCWYSCEGLSFLPSNYVFESNGRKLDGSDGTNNYYYFSADRTIA